MNSGHGSGRSSIGLAPTVPTSAVPSIWSSPRLPEQLPNDPNVAQTVSSPCRRDSLQPLHRSHPPRAVESPQRVEPALSSRAHAPTAPSKTQSDRPGRASVSLRSARLIWFGRRPMGKLFESSAGRRVGAPKGGPEHRKAVALQGRPAQ